MSKYVLRRIGVASNAAATRPSLSDCIELVLDQSDTLVGDVLDALKEPVLRPLKADAPDPVDPGVRYAVTHLLDEIALVRSSFGDALRRLVYHSGSQDFGDAPMSRLEDIHVFDVHALEAHIEQALARREVNRAVDDVLPLFNAQVSALLGWTSVQPAMNPLKPEAFVRALQEMLAVCVADEAVRGVLLRPAAQAMGHGMALLYRQTCDWLRSQGVAPVSAADARAARGARPPGRKAETELDRTLEILDKLRALLGVEAQPGGGGMQDFIHTVPAALVALQDLKMEESMFQRLKRQALPVITAPVRPPEEQDMLRPEPVLAQARNRQIGRQLGEEVVRLMFDQLGQDERIPVPVRLQLRPLEPAMLRLSQSDPRFFLDRAHPARSFMDRVVQCGIGLVRDDDDAVQGFSSCVAQAVATLLRGRIDAEAFERAWEFVLRSWGDFEQQRRAQREAAERARDHAARRDELAARLSTVLSERLRQAGLPALVAGFLRGPWTQVLAEARLRSTPEDPDPRAYMALVDDLVWSVQRPTDARDYARLIKLIPRLLARINEGLVLIDYPQEPLSIFLDELIALHERVLGEHRAAMAAARAAQATPVPPAGADLAAPAPGLAAEAADPPPEALAESDSALDVLPAPETPDTAVEAGEWADLLLGGVWVRARLTWISPNRSLFMFVSGAGLAHAMTRRMMDRLQAQGRLRLGFKPPEFDLQIDTVHGLLTPQSDPD
ncbi:MAG: DUF1631 family protein [Rhodoferax sp.]|jgi:hypothetical protein|nr:DUF1631 family protein [Rhodoferax sp.]